jgi:hypothetical protein
MEKKAALTLEEEIAELKETIKANDVEYRATQDPQERRDLLTLLNTRAASFDKLVLLLQQREERQLLAQQQQQQTNPGSHLNHILNVPGRCNALCVDGSSGFPLDPQAPPGKTIYC